MLGQQTLPVERSTRPDAGTPNYLRPNWAPAGLTPLSVSYQVCRCSSASALSRSKAERS